MVDYPSISKFKSIPTEWTFDSHKKKHPLPLPGQKGELSEEEFDKIYAKLWTWSTTHEWNRTSIAYLYTNYLPFYDADDARRKEIFEEHKSLL